MKLNFTNNRKIHNIYHIYTDGACSGNPGPGGYGVVVFDENEQVIHRVLQGQDEDTTNNRMELSALLNAFHWIDEIEPSVPVELINLYYIYSDSAYAITALTEWCKTWSNNGWKTAKGKPIENSDLILPLYTYKYNKYFYVCQLEKIQGHTGNFGNELADAVATQNDKKFWDTIYKRDAGCWVDTIAGTPEPYVARDLTI